MPEEAKKPLPNSNSEASLKASESQDKLDVNGTPKRKKKPQFKKLSIDVLAPLIVDRTDLQSPIKVDNPEFVALAPLNESINSPGAGGSQNNLDRHVDVGKHVNIDDNRDNQPDQRALPTSGSNGKAVASKDDTGIGSASPAITTAGTANTPVAAVTKHVKQASAPAPSKESSTTPVITQVQPSIITQVTPQTAAQTNLAAAKSRAGTNCLTY